MLSENDRCLVEGLINETNCGVHLGLKALDFVKKYEHESVTMIGFVKAKTLAVGTPNLTFLERVKKFSE